MQKPKAAEEKRREEQEERQYQLRGCGDHTCAQCNRETASMARGGTVTGRMSRPSCDSSMMEEIIQCSSRRLENIEIDSLYDTHGRNFPSSHDECSVG